jgi:hypothetical protein
MTALRRRMCDDLQLWGLASLCLRTRGARDAPGRVHPRGAQQRRCVPTRAVDRCAVMAWPISGPTTAPSLRTAAQPDPAHASHRLSGATAPPWRCGVLASPGRSWHGGVGTCRWRPPSGLGTPVASATSRPARRPRRPTAAPLTTDRMPTCWPSGNASQHAESHARAGQRCLRFCRATRPYSGLRIMPQRVTVALQVAPSYHLWG